MAGSRNPILHRTRIVLRRAARKSRTPLWRDLAERLARPRRSRAEVNLSKLSRVTDPKDRVIVPGKVLGSGLVTHPLIIGALQYSGAARAKIRAAGGEPLTISQFTERFPDPQGVKLIGG